MSSSDYPCCYDLFVPLRVIVVFHFGQSLGSHDLSVCMLESRDTYKVNQVKTEAGIGGA